MKQLAFAILVFLTQPIIAQTINDTRVSRIYKDSTEHAIYKLKDSLRRLQYECFFYNHFQSVDSSVYNDSLVLIYKSKLGKVIKRHTSKYHTTDGFAYEVIEHYNRLEQPEFVEYWELARSSSDSSNYFIWKIYSYDRFVYDSIGRIATWIQYHPTYISRRKVARRDYKYGLDGKQTFTRTLIPIERFWD